MSEPPVDVALVGPRPGGVRTGGRRPEAIWRGRIEIRGVNPYILVRSRTAARIRPRRSGPIPVVFWINDAPGPPSRINLMPAGGGAFFLYLNGAVRRATRTTVGDRVVVRARFDPEYRGGPVHEMPPTFARGLARSARARRGWEELSPSRQKEILRYLAALKSPSARRRNVARALRVLSGSPGRFLGRDWGTTPFE